MTGDGELRPSALVTSLGAVRARISTACEAVGRDPQQVTLVAVTKTCPADDVAVLSRLGVNDIGESKDQEVRRKITELGPVADVVRWHLVGRLQTNKAKSVVGYASAVHSLDRAKLARALAEAAAEHRATPLDVFLQISLDDDPERGGVAIAALPRLAATVVERPELRLRGVMAVPPIGVDPEAAFARLAELSQQVQAEHPGADAISAGMSDDLEAAVRHGSTHVRVGTALLGRRKQVFS
ncbi:YggS family pyridoxal phosphate-dependent enzyme [uncultured Jatrophihabitans sp.]|uniref:YggS family pyridoxal phosphate-dependent enzyme n=1 Tax=uncultured Jatrophihabitans sp. TaxID=1610747 RepID=UPI0035C98106